MNKQKKQKAMDDGTGAIMLNGTVLSWGDEAATETEAVCWNCGKGWNDSWDCSLGVRGHLTNYETNPNKGNK